MTIDLWQARTWNGTGHCHARSSVLYSSSQDWLPLWTWWSGIECICVTWPGSHESGSWGICMEIYMYSWDSSFHPSAVSRYHNHTLRWVNISIAIMHCLCISYTLSKSRWQGQINIWLRDQFTYFAEDRQDHSLQTSILSDSSSELWRRWQVCGDLFAWSSCDQPLATASCTARNSCHESISEFQSREWKFLITLSTGWMWST